MRVLLFLFLFLQISLTAFARDREICPNVWLREGNLRLNGNERILVCGSNQGGSGWAETPVPQTQFHLRTILQNLGYMHPRFERNGNRLDFWMGSRTNVKALNVEGADGILRPERKRKVVGYALTPASLTDVQKWADLGLRSQGYACPTLDIQGRAWTQEVLVKVETGPLQKIGNLEMADLEGLDKEALIRYQPFETGHLYDIRETQLMSSRLLADGLFQNAYFLVRCGPTHADLFMKNILGRPRILRFGVGASTEEFPFMEVWFKNARLDDRASSFTSRLYASPREQSLSLDSELYWLRPWPRIFFGPRFRVAHQSERAYETNSAKTGADIGFYWDQWRTRFVGRGGPTINYTKTVRGIGPSDITYLTLEGSLSMMSHLYEFSSRQQDQGWSSNIFYRGQRKGLGSDVNVDRYEFSWKHLWNLGDYSPPLLVLGTRIETIWVDIEDFKSVNTLIPVDYRTFYGGDRNLRGFNRESINNGGLGYLSSGLLGFELRLIEELPFRLQPFLLWDMARLGQRRWTLDSPLFTSEGVGLRWMSPFGTFRFSAAHGRIFAPDAAAQGIPQQWVYFFSFGQEF